MDLSLYNYTKEEKAQLLKSITIIYDSAEKVNSHILDWFDKKKIKYIKRKLYSADYCFMIPKNESLGIVRDICFDNKILIERKAHLEELSTNFGKGREQFDDEFGRTNAKIIVMIENGSLEDIFNSNYNTDFKSPSYLASIFSYQFKYDSKFVFVDKNNSAQYIYLTFYYWLKSYLTTGK